MDINDFASACHDYAKRNGFWEPPKTFGDQIALMHSELSESLEAFRSGQSMDVPVVYNVNDTGNGKPDGVFIELGDCVIRIFDTMVYYGHNPAYLLRTKHEYNQTRPYRHGGKLI